MSPLGIFKGSGERYATAGQQYGLTPAAASMLFGREKTGLRDRSEGMDTRREIPYVLAGIAAGASTEVIELKIRTHHESSDNSTEWKEERWLVAMADVAERFPQITIEPRGALGRLFKGIGYKGVETGDQAFDKAYHVSGERETTLSILHPGMTAWLVAQRPADVRFELSGSCMLVARRDWGPDEVGTLLQVLGAFRGQLFAAAVAVAPAPVAAAAPIAPTSVAAARFCGSCGAALVPGAKFCGSCGASLVSAVG